MGEHSKAQAGETPEGQGQDRAMTRRDIVKGGTALAASLGLAPVLAACGGGNSSTAAKSTATATSSNSLFPDLKGKTITFVDYGGTAADAMARAYTTPFAKRTGVKMLHDAPYDPAKLKAQVQAGRVTWDVVNGDTLTAIDFCRKGLLEPIDPSILDGVDPKYKTGKCVVPVDVYASVLAYDKSKFSGNPPTSWADYFDTTKYPGKRGMWSAIALNQLEVALLGDGVKPEDLYPLDLNRAIAKLNTIKDDIVFYDSFAQSGEQMLSQSVVMTNTVNERAQVATRSGAKFAPVWNQAVLAWECYGIPKGSPNKVAAQALLRYMGTAEAQGNVAKSLGFGSTAKKPVAVKGLDANDRLWLPSTENTKNAVTVDPAWWADHYDEAVAKFTSWTSG
jgi:putative spermidine/putrescine transport system substrate-binding protein